MTTPNDFDTLLNSPDAPTNGPAPQQAHGDDFDALLNAPDAPINAPKPRTMVPVSQGPATTRALQAVQAKPGQVLTKSGSAGVPTNTKDIDWGKVGQQAIANLPKSAFDNIVVAPWQAVMHPVRTYHAMQNIEQGLQSKWEQATDIPQDPSQIAQKQAVVNAIGHDYANRFGLHGAAPVAEAMANDPGSYLGDALTVATLPFGGEGAAAKAPGILGKAAEVAGGIRNAAEAVNTYTNPIGLAGKAVSKIAPKVVKMAVPDAMKAAAPTGKLTPEMFDTDDAQKALQDTIDKKGVTPAAMREANLKSFGAPTPGSAVNDVKPSAAQADVDKAGVDTAKGIVAGAVQDTVGNAPPSPTAMGEALHQAHADSFNNYKAAYDQAATHEGEFAPAFADTFQDHLQDHLTQRDPTLPNTLEDMANAPESAYKTSQEMMPWMVNRVQELADGGNLTLQNVEGIRKLLNNGWATAQREGRTPDMAMISAMKSALDTHVENMAAAGHFSGDGDAVINDMQAARSAYAQHQATFNKAGPIKTAVQQLMKEQDLDENGYISSPPTAGATEMANNTLAKNLLDMRSKNRVVKPGANLLYNQLNDALGDDGMQSVNDHIRQTVGAVNQDGSTMALANSPDAIHSVLDHPLGQAAFDPTEQNMMRRAAEAQRTLTTKPGQGAAKASQVGAALHKTGTRVIGAGIGSAIGHVVPVVGSPVGAFVGERVAEGLSKAKATRDASKALTGAPNKLFLSGPRAVIGGAGKTTSNMSPMIGRATAQTYQSEDPQEDPNAPAAEAAQPHSQPIAITPDDRDALIRMAYGESRGEGPQGQAAAIYTFLNRSMDSGRPVYDEVHALNASEAMTGNVDHGLNPNSPQYKRLGDLVDQITAGNIPDPTSGARYFYNPELQAQDHAHNPARYKAVPDFARGSGMRIGRHVFYGGTDTRGHFAGGGAADDADQDDYSQSEGDMPPPATDPNAQFADYRHQRPPAPAPAPSRRPTQTPLPVQRYTAPAPVVRYTPAPAPVARSAPQPPPTVYRQPPAQYPPASQRPAWNAGQDDDDSWQPTQTDEQRAQQVQRSRGAFAPTQSVTPKQTPPAPQPVQQSNVTQRGVQPAPPTRLLHQSFDIDDSDDSTGAAQPAPRYGRQTPTVVPADPRLISKLTQAKTKAPVPQPQDMVPASPQLLNTLNGNRPPQPTKTQNLSASDRDALIRMVYGEANTEPVDGQVAAIQTFINRASKAKQTVHQAVNTPWASEAVTKGVGSNLNPNSKTYQQLGQVVDQVASGQLQSKVPDAVHFYAPDVQAQNHKKNPSMYAATPPWAAGRTDGVRIGNMVYYPDRSKHKAGGRVGHSNHEHLVGKLMNAAEKAKKAELSHTKPLLHESDSAIARALHIAKRGI